jgi:hypothetical protein
MRRRLIMTAAVLMLLGVMPTTAAGQEIEALGTGNALIDQCGDAVSGNSDGGFFGLAYCQGLVRGISDMLEIYSRTGSGFPNPLYCVPESAILGQKIRVVLKFLEDFPEKLHLQDSLLVMVALTDGFPCPD